MINLEEWQLERIEDTFRLIANTYESKERKTCLDRDIMLCWNMVYNALHDRENGDTLKYRMRVGQTPYNDDEYSDIRETEEYKKYQKECEHVWQTYDTLDAKSPTIYPKSPSPKEYGMNFKHRRKKK